jgi:hypothetical protein
MCEGNAIERSRKHFHESSEIETNNRSAFERFSVPIPNDVSAFVQLSVPNDIPAITTSSFNQLNVPTIAQHLLILGLATIPCPSTSILSTLLRLQN